jgi:hypothetical protein
MRQISVTPGFLGGGQHGRLQLAGRGDHGDAVDAGHLGGHGVHQHGRGIGRAAAGHIDAHGLQRRPAPAQLHAGLVGPGLILRTLAGVEGADAGGGEGDGLADLGRGLGRAGLDLLGGDADRVLGQFHAVEAAGEAEHGLQALGLDGLQHVARGRVDILGRAPALVEEGLEGGGERTGRRS